MVEDECQVETQMAPAALESLNENLNKKAFTYQVAALRPVFLLNNYDHIVRWCLLTRSFLLTGADVLCVFRTLQKAPYLSVLQKVSPQVRKENATIEISLSSALPYVLKILEKYETLLVEQRQAYLHATWGHALVVFEGSPPTCILLNQLCSPF